MFWNKKGIIHEEPSQLPAQEVAATSPAPLPQQGARNSSLRDLPWAKAKRQENVVFCCYITSFAFWGKGFWSNSSTASGSPAESRSSSFSGFSVKALLNFTLSDLSTFLFGISFCLLRATIKTKEVPSWENEVWCAGTQRWFDNTDALGRKAEDEVQHVITVGSDTTNHCYPWHITWSLGMSALPTLRGGLQKYIH